MVKFPTRIPDCDSDSPDHLDLFISSATSIRSARAFSPLGNSDQVVVSVSIYFPIKSRQDALFHRVAYDYSHTDLDGLGRTSLNSVLLLLLVNFSRGFRLELMSIFLIVSDLSGFQQLVVLP